MKPFTVTVFSRLPHNAQVLTGFRMLQQQGLEIELHDCTAESSNPFPGSALIRAEYRRKTIFYDLWDGYQRPNEMRLALDQADFYFKRSFSRAQNQLLFPGDCDKMYPLGFNYHVTFPGTPFSEPVWKAGIKQLLGRVPNRYFTPDKFEGTAVPVTGSGRILFLTRLWDPEEPGLSPQLKLERETLNTTRIAMLRSLKQNCGSRFVGGLNDAPISRKLAPDLIVPDSMTNRKQYLRLLQESDICIATTGLHGSIGWKTGEYVAAAKAIVSEPLLYEVPGSFRDGTHYLTFSTPEECLTQVRRLLADPAKVLAMKRANEAYYRQYLRPDVMINNTLAIVERQPLR